MNDKEKLKLLKSKFIKVCTNGLPAGEPYRHPDLNRLSKEAKEKGKSSFYYENYKKGESIRCREAKPKYIYKLGLKEFLTIEEFDEIFDGID